MPVRQATADSRPRLGLSRRQEPPRSARGRAVRNSFERVYAVHAITANLSGRGLNNRLGKRGDGTNNCSSSRPWRNCRGGALRG